MAQSPREDCSYESLQEVWVDCGWADQCCLIPQPEPKFIPLILYYIQQWSSLLPKKLPSPLSHVSPHHQSLLTLPKRKSQSCRKSSASMRSVSSKSKNLRSQRSMSSTTLQLRNLPQSQSEDSTRRHMKRKENTRSSAEKSMQISQTLRTSRAGTRRSSRLWEKEG